VNVCKPLAPGGGGVLATAGADASIKLWDLSEYASEAQAVQVAGSAGAGDDGDRDRPLEVFTGPSLPPGTLGATSGEGGGDGVSDSKCESVRDLLFAAPGVLYVATNRGLLHRVQVGAKKEWTWRLVHRTEPVGPIMSLTLMDVGGGDGDGGGGTGGGGGGGDMHRLALGDAHGRVTVVAAPAAVDEDDIGGGVGGASAETTIMSGVRVEASWQASEPRRLLDVCWSAPEGGRGGGGGGGGGSLFTSEVGGVVRWWRQQGGDGGGGDGGGGYGGWVLAGVAAVPFCRRVLAVAFHAGCGVLLCGDQAGNIAAFAAKVHGTGKESRQLPLLAAMRAAHGRAVQADPMKPTVKAPRAKRLKLSYDEPPSNFAFQFNLRRYSTGRTRCHSRWCVWRGGRQTARTGAGMMGGTASSS